MDTVTLTRLALSDHKIKYKFGGVFASDMLPQQKKHYRSFIVNTDLAQCKDRKRFIDDLEDDDFPPMTGKTPAKATNNNDYKHALTVFDAFECQTFSDYLEIYQNVDVIMLAEIFLSFRRTSMQSYHLDPVHFITSAQLTRNAGLKISKVELQLLGDVNEYLWFEKSMRGGVCLLRRRHAIANNPYITENYNKKLPSNYILALDANNLYGFATSQFLPVGNIRWLASEQLSKFNVLDLDED
ncbi:c2H2-type domain-containing protein [Trichonephila clavipes]|nr:c2H2-type domain-containing protein [Trichonephila clavipes]